MLDSIEETEGNVVSLFSAKKNSGKEPKEKKEEASEEENSFLAIMRKNLDNHKRMKSERTKANKGVIRSYRLKR